MGRLRRERRRLSTAVGASLAVLLLGGGVVTVGGPAAAAAAEEVYTRPSSGSWTVSGHGYGHGRGMSAWGAYGAAYLGKGYQEILSTYYPGTASSTVGNETIRVRLTADAGAVRVSHASGLAVVESTGARTALPAADQWRLVPSGAGLQLQSLTAGAWNAFAVNGSSTLSSPVRFEGPARIRVWKPDNTSTDYPGVVSALLASNAVTTVLSLPLETYVGGVVSREVIPSWPAAALRAFAVSARTIGVQFIRRANATYDICDTTQCQVFTGPTSYSSDGTATDLWYSASTAAGTDTSGQILTYQGVVATTQYSASNGGWSTDGGLPYLPAREDPWDGAAPGDPVHSWQATLPVSALEAAFPAIGSLQRLVVVSRDGRGEWGGRVLGVRLEGSSGSVTTTGAGVMNARPYPASRDGLRSSWWSLGSPAPPVPQLAPVFFTSALSSPNGEYRMVMQSDGNLVVYSASGLATWATGTRVPGSFLVLQSDGNLVMYDSRNAPVWTTATSAPGATLQMQNDGNLVLYDGYGRPVWDSGGYAGRAATYLPVTTVVTELASGAAVVAPRGGFRLVMRTSGAAEVVAASDGRVLWSTRTAVAGSWLAGQPDGNVVVYAPGNRPVWSSGVFAPGARLILQDDGNLVTYADDGRAVWDSLGYARR